MSTDARRRFGMAVALRRAVGILSAIFFLLGSWTIAPAWIFHSDLREASNFAPVGIIEFVLPEGHSKGTAFLVGECAIMTNFHVAFGPWYLTALRPPSSSVLGTFTLTQVTSANGEHPSTDVNPVIWGDYTGPDRQFRKPGEDWVVLALRECLGARYGYLKPYDAVLSNDIPGKGGFVAVGYSSGRQMVDADCSVRVDGDKTGTTTVLHDCVTLSGDSGSPILIRGTGRVVAIVSSFHADRRSNLCKSETGIVGEEWSSLCTNVAVPFDVDLVSRVNEVSTAIYVQNQLLSLGYDVGPLGAIDKPLFHEAVKKFQRESGITPNGAAISSLCPAIMAVKMRALRVQIVE